MKKRIASVLTTIFLISILLVSTAYAAVPRRASAPSLSFSGTTANCSASCYGNSSQDTVSVTLTLYQGNTYVDSWSGSGKYHVSVSGSCGVQSGKSYKLTLDYSINGVKQTSVSTSKVCP